MAGSALKTRIIKRLAKEQDAHVLKAIDILLRETTKEDALRRRINEMAVRSEEAIRKGDVLTLAEARKRSKTLLKEIAAERSSARPASAVKPSARKA
jgi:ribosomal protein S17